MRSPVTTSHILCIVFDIFLSQSTYSVQNFKIGVLFEKDSNPTELINVFGNTTKQYRQLYPHASMEINAMYDRIDLSNSFAVSNASLYVRSTAKVMYGREKLRKKEKPDKKVGVERHEEAGREILTRTMPRTDIAGDLYCAQVCEHLEKGAYIIIGMSRICALATIRSFTDKFEVPYITLSMALNMSSSLSYFPYQLYMIPEYIDGLLEIIIKKGWTKVIYLYDNDEGLMRLQQIFQAFNAREIENVDFHVKRVLNVNHCYETINATYESVKNIPKIRDDYLLHIMLDIPIKDCERILRRVRGNPEFELNRFHFILADLGLNDLDHDVMKHGLNITAFDFRLQKPMNSSLEKITLRKALVIDTAELVYKTLNSTRHLNVARDPAMCRNSRAQYQPGEDLMKTLRNTSFRGLTGLVEFDNRGFRKNFNLSLYETTMNMAKSKVGYYLREKGMKTHDPVREDIPPKNGSEDEGKIKRVTTVLDKPYVMIKESSKGFREREISAGRQVCGKEHFEGFCIDLAEKISQKLNFSYEICLVKDGYYGKKLADETWNGMVGELTKNEADLAIAPITISSARERVVDFTKPFMSLGISIMIKKPSNTKAHVFSFMDPLSYEIWMCILFAYVGVSVVLFLVSRFSPSEWHIEEDSNITNDFTISNSLWYSLGAFMQQGCDISPKAVSGRIAGSVWWFFTLIIISSYTANLAAFLTVSRMNTPIESAEDLAKQTNIQYGVLEDGTTRDFFKHSKVAIYERMWAYMTSATPKVFVKNNTEGIQRVREKNGKYAFLVESTINEYNNLQKPCDTMKVGSNLDSKGYGIATPVGSKMRDDLTLAVLHFRESGELQEMKKKWWDKRSECPPAKSASDGQQTALTLNNVAGIFYILISGLTMAVLIAGCEFLYKSIVDSKKSQTSFGSVLRSKARLSFRGSIDKDSSDASGPGKKNMATYTYTGPPQLPGFDPYPDTNNTHTQV